MTNDIMGLSPARPREYDEAAVRRAVEWVNANSRLVAERDFGHFCLVYLSHHFSAGFGRFQEDIFQDLSNLKPDQHALYLISRGHGKCARGLTMVSMYNGGVKHLKDIVRGDVVVSYNEATGKFEPKEVTHSQEMGVKDIYRMRTKGGTETFVAETHKFLTSSGDWKELKDLSPGDRIAAPRYIPEPAHPENMTEDELVLLAYYVTEGCGGSARVSNFDVDILKLVQKSARALGGDASLGFCEEAGRYEYVGITQGEKWKSGKDLLRSVGVEPDHQLSVNVSLPDSVFKMDNAHVAFLLKHMFEGDGWATTNGAKGKPCVGYGTSSEALAKQVKTLLLRLGIVSRLVTKKVAKARLGEVYELTIYDRKNVERFREQVGFFKKEIPPKTEGTSQSFDDMIPGDLLMTAHPWGKVPVAAVKEHTLGLSSPYGERDHSRDKIERLSNYTGNAKLARIVNDDVWWDEIREIEYHETDMTYDITVKDNENYLADDLLHHNTTLISLCFVVWNICYRRRKHIVLGAAVRELSEKFLANIKLELETNQKIREDFGDLVGKQNRKLDAKSQRPYRASYIRTANYVVVTTASAGTSVRGLLESLPDDLEKDFVGLDASGSPIFRTKTTRVDLFILDDMIDDKKVNSQDVRDKLWDWFWNNVFSAQELGCGNVVVVGTTLHEDDLVCRLYKDKTQTATWVKRKLPACDPEMPFDADGNPRNCLFPEYWGRTNYNRPIVTKDPYTQEETTVYRSHLWWRAQELGPSFGPEMLLQPMSDATKMFFLKDFRDYVVAGTHGPDLKQTYRETMGRELETLPSDLMCVTSIDPAGTEEARVKEGTDPDYTAIETWGYSPSTKKFYLVGINHGRFSTSEMMRLLMMHGQMFDRRFGGTYRPDQIDSSKDIQGFNFTHLGYVIETVAFQKVLSNLFEELAASMGFYPIVFEASRSGGRGKRIRAMLPAHLSQLHQIVLPYGSHARALTAFTEELENFPGAGGHDDCFPAGTEVLTVNKRGQISETCIEEVRRGDYVLTRNGPRKVLKAWSKGYRKVINRFGITATPEHRVWTDNRGWASLESLTGDDLLLAVGRGLLEPRAIEADELEAVDYPGRIADYTTEVFDLHVETNHEFFVVAESGEAVLVHNCVDAFTDAITALYSYSLGLGRGLGNIDAIRDIMQNSDFRVDEDRVEEVIRTLHLDATAQVVPATMVGS